MASDFETKQTPNLFRAILARYGATLNAKNAAGATVSVSLVVLPNSIDVEPGSNGRDSVQRARIAIAVANVVTDAWQFDALGDGNFWAVDRETDGIKRIGGGMYVLPIVRSLIFDRGDPEYRAKG